MEIDKIKPKRRRSKTVEETLIAERRAKALYYSVRGRSYETIAEISQRENWEPRPYNSRQAVHEDIKAALKARQEERNEMAGEWIQQELLKLDAMEDAAWTVLESLHYVVNQGEVVYVYPDEQPDRVKQGWARPKLDMTTRIALEEKRAELAREPLVDNKPVLDALTVLLKIAERRAKLLGLDAPVKKQIEVSAGVGVDDRIERVLAQLAGGGQGEATPGGIAALDSTQLPDTRSSRAHGGTEVVANPGAGHTRSSLG